MQEPDGAAHNVEGQGYAVILSMVELQYWSEIITFPGNGFAYYPHYLNTLHTTVLYSTFLKFPHYQSAPRTTICHTTVCSAYYFYFEFCWKHKFWPDRVQNLNIDHAYVFILVTPLLTLKPMA